MFNNRIMRDKVDLLKLNGDVYKDIKSCVQTNVILIDDISIPIEEGDSLIRILPNDMYENYIVEDRGFISGVGKIQSHYQVKVKKENIYKEKAANSPVNNFYGDINNSQIQQNVQNSSQTMSTNESYDKKNELQKWLKGTLKQNLSSISLEPSKLEAIEIAVKNIEYELEKSNSKPSIIKDGLSSIKTVLEGAAGNLLASGLLYQLSQF